MFKSKLLIFCFFLIAYGGSNQWEKRSADLTSCDISKILFVNNDTGFVFGDSGFIARTTDSGNTWDDISISQDIRIGDACFISPNHIIAVGENGNFITSDDFGENWDISIVNMEYDNIRVFSFDGKNIWIGSESGTLFNTTDSGKIWDKIKLPNDGMIFSIFFINQNYGWITGESGLLYRTINGGQEWIETEQIESEVFNEIYFKDLQTGWVVGDRIQYSNDGGKTWIVQQDRIYQVMRGMCFIDSLNGFVVADYSKMLSTTDGGISWDTTSMNIPYIYPLDIVNNGKDLWIVGRNGIICKSSIIQAFIMNRPYSINQSNRNRNLILFNLLGQYLHAIPRTNQLVIKKTGSKYNKSILAGNDKSHAINKK